MSRLRISVGLAACAAVLALAVSSPAYAHTRGEGFVTGKFTASIFGQTISPSTPATASGKATIETEENGKGETINVLNIGPFKNVECRTVRGKSTVESENAPNMKMEITFSGCSYTEHVGTLVHHPHLRFKTPLVLELHGNGATKILKIDNTQETELKASGYSCKILIESQEIPLSAERNPYKEYETIQYSTETEEVEGAKLKKFPRGFYEYLGIEMHLKAVGTKWKPVVLTEEEEKKGKRSQCEYKRGEEGQFNKETGYVEQSSKIGLDFTEYKLKNGNIGFEPVKEE